MGGNGLGVARAVGYHYGNHRAFGGICGAGDGGGVVVGVVGRVNRDFRHGGVYAAFIGGFAFVAGRVFYACINSIFTFGKLFGHFHAVSAVFFHLGGNGLGVARAVSHHHGNHRAFGRICGTGDGRGVVVGVLGNVNRDFRGSCIHHTRVAGLSFVTQLVRHFCRGCVFAIRQRVGHFNLIAAICLHGSGYHLGAAVYIGDGYGDRLAGFHIGGGAGDQRGVVVG